MDPVWSRLLIRPRSTLGGSFFPVACGTVLALFLIGCPGAVPITDTSADATNVDSAPNGTIPVSGQIVSLSTNILLSTGDPPITVTYAFTGTPDSISAFYVPVVDNSPGAAPIGEQVEVATGLPASGADTRFTFDPGRTGVGFFRVGVLWRVGADERNALSVGVIHVQALPSPCFIQPCVPASEGAAETDTFASCGTTRCQRINIVAPGTQVSVGFDLGVPVGEVQWRLFFLAPGDSKDNPPDALGTQIDAGSGNLGLATFSTTDLAAGDYELGISATDSGRSIAGTAASGQLDRIVTVFGPVVHIAE